METKQVKLRIIAVGNETKSITQTKTTRTVVLTVREIPSRNPFGHNKENPNPFDVEVHNHNIETFNISPSLIDEVAICELDINHYSGHGGPSVPKFIVNDLTFRI